MEYIKQTTAVSSVRRQWSETYFHIALSRFTLWVRSRSYL